MKVKRKNIGLKHDFYFFTQRVIYLIKNKFFRLNNHKYLFILSPPYSGSTLLTQVLSTSKNVSCNNHIATMEGQLLPGVRDFMYKKNRWNKNINYDWKKIKSIWMKYWDLSKPILMDKTTTNIMRVDEIKKSFKDIYLVLLVRNPYAVVEGIIRRNNKSVEFAANFVLKTLKYQKENFEKNKNCILITYSEVCDKQSMVKKKIKSLLPEIGELNFNKHFKAHNFKKKSLRITNLNDEKIKKIKASDLILINSFFIKEKELLDFFNFKIIT